MPSTRGKNCSYYHYMVMERNEDGEYNTDPKYFKTLKELKEEYDISRANVHRLLTHPECNTRFPHKIIKNYVQIPRPHPNFIENPFSTA